MIRLVGAAAIAVAVSCTGDGNSPELVVDEGVTVSDDDAHQIVAMEVVAMTREHCGATFSLDAGNRAMSGAYVVGVYPELTRGKILKSFPTSDDVRAFIQANADVLALPSHTLGTYCEVSGGTDCHKQGALTCYLDVSRETSSLRDAARLARACNQKSIAWLAEGGVKIIDQEAGKPFGTGESLSGDALAPCAAARQK